MSESLEKDHQFLSLMTVMMLYINILEMSLSVIISCHGGTIVGKHLHRSLLRGLEPPKGLHY